VRNLADLVRRAAVASGERPALRWHDQVLTWMELDGRVDAVARSLSRLALRGDTAPARVVIALPNVPEFAAVFFGVLRAGLTAVPVNPGYTARALRHVLTDCQASVLVGTADLVGTAEPVGTPGVVESSGEGGAVERPARWAAYSHGGVPPGATPVEALWGGATSPGAPAPDVGPPAAPGAGGDDLAVLLYTSGTSGAPKGAMLSHAALLANHRQLDEIRPAPLGPDDVALLALPMFHAYGLNSGLIAVAYHGATGVLAERFDPADSLALIARHKVTAVVGVPTMFLAWSLMEDRLAQDFASVQLAVCGAAPLDPAVARRFAGLTGRPLDVGYGLTETAPVLTCTLVGPSRKPGSIGRPLAGVEVKLVMAGGGEVPVDGPLDEDDFDDDAPGSPGTDPGELVVRGPNLFSGYWPDGRGGPDADGWWATADVAYADVDGDLFLVDRLGELILVSGFNVYPAEVEQVIAAHPAVAEAAVIGIAHPYTGQTVKAYVVRAAGVAASAEELMRHCERNLARFKCPTAVEFVGELPHSAIGKVRKTELRGLS
jgi:long-chain acyl-CoA synthetase